MRILKSHPLFTLVNSYLVDSPQRSNRRDIFASNVRYFSSSSVSYNPDNNGKPLNDQEKLIQKIDKLYEEWSEIDAEVEEFKDLVHEEEEVEGDPEETTELSKMLREDSDNKDDIIGSYQEPIDRAAFDTNNVREEKSLQLDQVQASVKADLHTVRTLKSELAPMDYSWDKADKLSNKLENIQQEASSLKEEWHKNDLPPISENVPQDSSHSHVPQDSSHVPQDSSDVHQTEFDSSDYYED
jgi:DNA repair ATPase RecN